MADPGGLWGLPSEVFWLNCQGLKSPTALIACLYGDPDTPSPSEGSLLDSLKIPGSALGVVRKFRGAE